MTPEFAAALASLNEAQRAVISERIVVRLRSSDGFWVGALVVPDQIRAQGVPVFVDGQLAESGRHLRAWSATDATSVGIVVRNLAFDDSCSHPSWLDLSGTPRDALQATLTQLDTELGTHRDRLARNHPCGLLVAIPPGTPIAGDARVWIEALERLVDLTGVEAAGGTEPTPVLDAPEPTHRRGEDELAADELQRLQALLKEDSQDRSVTQPLADLLPRMRAAFGTAHSWAWQTRVLLTQCLVRDGDHAGAARLLEEQLAVTSWGFGADSPTAVSGAIYLSAAYKRAGRRDDAIHVLSDAGARCEASLGADHEQTLRARLELGKLIREAGRLEEALSLLAATAAGLERIAGPDVPRSLDARAELALAQYMAGRLDEALHSAQAVVNRAGWVFDPSDKRTAEWRRLLGMIHARLGHEEDAAEAFERCLSYYRTRLDPSNPDVVRLLTLAGIARVKSGNPEAAVPLLEEALPFEPDPDPLSGARWLARAYIETNQPARSIPVLEQMLTGVDADDAAEILVDRGRLAKAYRATGRHPEAVEQFERLVADYERVLGETAYETLRTRWALGTTYMLVRRFNDAIANFEPALLGLDRLLGTEHPDTLILGTMLGHAYELAGELEKAVATYGHAASVAERALGPEHQISRRARQPLTALLSGA